MERPTTFLCLSCELKGVELIKSLKLEGNLVYLVTSEALRDAAWPREAIDEIFYVQESKHCIWNMEDVIDGLGHFMRTHRVDRVIAIDDFDVEKGALLRETFRIPGMGQTTVRHFRDKLAMRMKAFEQGILVPRFSALFNDDAINEFLETTPAPWIIKPRAEAAAAGLTKVGTKEECWETLHNLGGERHQFLIEQFKPGDVFHVDSITYDGKTLFSRVSKYMNTPFEVAHGGGIFRSRIEKFGSKDEKALQKLNAQLLKAFGMVSGVSHTEFIKNHEDGKFYFLETSFRVGGAHLSEMVEMSSGINLWSEWGRVETAVARNQPYELPPVRDDYSGIVISLTKDKTPDISSFQDSEIVWLLKKDYHIGFIVKADNQERVEELLDQYAERIYNEFHASHPARKTFHE